MREEFQCFIDQASSDEIENLIAMMELTEDRELEQLTLGLTLLLG